MIIMIFINLNSINVPEDWIKEGINLTNNLLELTDEEKIKFINSHSNYWRKFKELFENFSNNKCWYCEIKDIRSDKHIDHHRPKNRLENEEGSNIGYWWLAFNYTNYRLACSYCNCLHTGKDGITRGKADKFPLLPGTPRCQPFRTPINERPILLDPIDPLDPPLLTFLDNGLAHPAYDLTQNEILYIRANDTIEILNLNDIKIIEARKFKRIQINRLVREVNELYSLYIDNDQISTDRIRSKIIEIFELISEHAELSSATRIYLRGSGEQWIEMFHLF